MVIIIIIIKLYFFSASSYKEAPSALHSQHVHIIQLNKILQCFKNWIKKNELNKLETLMQKSNQITKVLNDDINRATLEFQMVICTTVKI